MTVKITFVTKLGELLTRKYLEWQVSAGKRKTLDEFAAYIGISRPLLNMWSNGKRKPGTDKIKSLADMFGNEIYDALDLPRPDPDLHYLQAHWINLPAEARKAIRETASKYITRKKDK